MPPSTFASAAAGNAANQNATRESGPDWSRRANGATQTFRRPSGATNLPNTQQHDGLAQQPPRYVPPHRNGVVSDSRYAKDQMLDLYRTYNSAEAGLEDGMSSLFVGGWHPDVTNGTAAGWGRGEHAREPQTGPDICWLKDPAAEPLGLLEMDDEERELFSTSVNTPIKLPSATNKDGQQVNGMPGRKVSISGTTPGGFGLPSPSIARGPGRRRDTSESYPFPQNNLTSPSAGGFNSHDQRAASPPPSLLRRRTDFKDLTKVDDRDKDGEEKSTSSPFGTLKRHPTGPLSAGFGAPSSPWSSTAGPQSAGLPPMGSFGNFGLGGAGGPQGIASDKRPGLGAGRSESRFKNLLSKDSNEDVGSRTLERKTSISSLSRVNENDSWRPQERLDPSNGPLQEAEEDAPNGSAALAADADISPQHGKRGYRGFGTPSRQPTQDEYGFGAFGMTSDNTHGHGQGFGRDAFQQTPAHQRMGNAVGGNEPMSPTDTNPYQSPEQHGLDRNHEDTDPDRSDLHNTHLPGLGGLNGLGALPNLGRNAALPGAAGDRSQTSSVGPNRGFPGLGGFGGLGGMPGSAAWSASQGGLGTPSRQSAGLSNAFGNGLFSPMTELQSPGGLPGLGATSALGQAPPFGSSRLASLFPSSGAQDDREQARRGSVQPFGGLDDANSASDPSLHEHSFSLQGQAGDSNNFGAPGQPQQDRDLDQSQQPPPGSSASNQPPAPQQRTMVMPDRMRWIYRDPQGQTQGPWSGLEMHDWYKAGFFSPELLVKKYEDPEYEPLAQLIRRIGNSREPFLVPQIGIPHGSAASTGPNAWAGAGSQVAGTAATGAQPPFASSFPSFGTTLTADQQNALERRKQEEQYLMARQKEHLAQSQMAQRMHPGGHSSLMPGQLHHHSSAHSLQSQPSFGSITSPGGYQPSPTQGPASGGAPGQPGFFDNSFRLPGGLSAVGAGVDSLGHIREEEIPGIMNRLDIGGTRGGPGQFGAPGQPFGAQQQDQLLSQDDHEHQVRQMLQDRARLQQEQAEHDAQEQADEQTASNDRLQHFQQLQGQGRANDMQFQDRQAQTQARQVSTSQSSTASTVSELPQQCKRQESLSLTEQVQKAASAKHTPTPQQPGLPQPFPPAPSQSPLPAPAAQRTGRQSFADQLQTESRDASQTPSVETPTAAMAPWAKEQVEAPKGPSLKEIQQAEAKKAAEVEALAVATRRAQFQRELEQQAANAAIPAAPGLPAGSNWATGSPATPTGSASAAWAKATQKPAAPLAAKSMAQIQKEEEARKRRQAQSAAAQAHALNNSNNNSAAVPLAGKSYALLAGKVAAAPPPVGGGNSAWTTVGAGGKTKAPIAPATGAPVLPRTASASGVPATLQPSNTIRKAPSRTTTLAAGSSTTTSGPSNSLNPQDELRKWAVASLRPDLNRGINAEEFAAQLVFLGNEVDIITEAVHGVSNTIDSRHFAEEFVRRKKAADKGVVVERGGGSPASAMGAAAGAAAGWSEVAAKKNPKESGAKSGDAMGDMFRVVAGKKRGKR